MPDQRPILTLQSLAKASLTVLSLFELDSRSGASGQDKYPDSILDFVFVASAAKDWQAESYVVVREGDFPDSDQTSDHRPIIMTLALTGP